MNFFNRKPKAVALRLSEIADLEEKLTGMEATCKELQEQAKRDAAHIEAQGKAIADLHGELAMAHEVEVSQAEVIATQKAMIEGLERDFKQLTAEAAAALTKRDALAALSREAIRLLLQPGGMRLPWQAKRKKLIEKFKALGIEEE